MSIEGSLHSTSALALALACALQVAEASHCTIAIGGSSSPSHWPLQLTLASPIASPRTSAAPVQSASGPRAVHSPEHLPWHSAPAFASVAHEPSQVPSQRAPAEKSS